MKKRISIIVLILITGVLVKAQGVFTIFSEDGDRFTLYLNSVQQNPMPQANVRVDGLTGDWYSAKIVFEDPKKNTITKNLNTKDAATGQFQEMIYKIKNKDGEMKLRYFSMNPVPASYSPDPSMYQAHYGQQPAPAGNTSNTTVTTTTTSTSANPNNVNMNVGAGGVSLSMNVSDPDNGGNGNVSINMNLPAGATNTNMNGNVNTSTRVTQTTTSTSSYSSGSNGYQNNSNSTQQTTGGCSYPMDPTSFNSAKTTIKNASFEDTKMSTAKSILAANCVSTDQVIQLCNLFSFEENKLAFAKFAYSRTTDPGNFFKVANVFSFDASKNDLNNFIASGGR